MNAGAGLSSAGLDLASIPERIQSEVQRAIQRSIKGVEYISTSGPSLGSTPKDILSVRGTMNLYHYRPVADEIYRVPILIVWQQPTAAISSTWCRARVSSSSF